MALRIEVIGIGAGNPEHMTIQAIKALNAADLVLIPRKGVEKDDLAALRREICGLYLENPATRLVEFDLPVRDAGGDYGAGVEAWHRAIAEVYRDALAGVDGTAALLVWGDPSIYDSSLRILGHLRDLGAFDFTVSVVPGITSAQGLAARHGMALNTIGGDVLLTTGRRLRAGWPEGARSVVVMLDGDCAFTTLPGAEFEIFWGAYLGMEGEIAFAGNLDEIGPRIVAARAAARAARGWIMDIYLLRRR